MRKFAFCFVFLLAGGLCAQQRQVIKLWPGKAPGSEDWNFSERVVEGRGGGRTYSNVVEPSLTVYLPDPAKANGTAIIFCSGGGMRTISIDERDRTAEFFNSRGIAFFNLKYRVVPDTSTPAATGGDRGAVPTGGRGAAPGGPRPQADWQQRGELSFREIQRRNGNANPSPEDQLQFKVIDMAIADGKQAIRYLRSHAAEFHINPSRIGIMGVSAGGGVAIGTALAEPGDAYPDFVATVFGPSLVDVNVPKHGAPLFITVGSNHFNVTNGCLAVFALWKEAGRPVELHIYDQIPGSPGMPVNTWIDRLYEWLQARRFVAN